MRRRKKRRGETGVKELGKLGFGLDLYTGEDREKRGAACSLEGGDEAGRRGKTLIIIIIGVASNNNNSNWSEDTESRNKMGRGKTNPVDIPSD